MVDVEYSQVYHGPSHDGYLFRVCMIGTLNINGGKVTHECRTLIIDTENRNKKYLFEGLDYFI